MVGQYFLRSKNEKQTPLEVERVDEYDEIHGKRLHNFCHFSFVFLNGRSPYSEEDGRGQQKKGSGVMFFEGLSCIAVVGG